jgi:hypothetical protein
LQCVAAAGGVDGGVVGGGAEEVEEGEEVKGDGAGGQEGGVSEGGGGGGSITRAGVKAARQLRLLTSCEAGVVDTIAWLRLLLARYRCRVPKKKKRLRTLAEGKPSERGRGRAVDTIAIEAVPELWIRSKRQRQLLIRSRGCGS